jgi:hypothetical protein
MGSDAELSDATSFDTLSVPEYVAAPATGKRHRGLGTNVEAATSTSGAE